MQDRTWVLYQKRIQEAIAESSWYTLGTIYYEMAARLTEDGEDGNYLRDQGYKAKLQHHQKELDNHVLEQVEIMVNQRACPQCLAHHGEIYNAEDARLMNPVPVPDCSNDDGCRCIYLPVIP